MPKKNRGHKKNYETSVTKSKSLSYEDKLRLGFKTKLYKLQKKQQQNTHHEEQRHGICAAICD